MYLNSFCTITVQTNHSGHVTERDKHTKKTNKRLFFTKKVQDTQKKPPSFKSHNSLQ